MLGQAVHVFEAVFSYVFAPHSIQASPSLPEYPALHTHAVTAVEPVLRVVLSAGHEAQASFETRFLNVPVPQASHISPFLKCPTSHKQAPADVLPAGDIEFS